MPSDWIKVVEPSQLPPEGVVVLTKIDDERGVRNEYPLKRQGRLWFFADGSMYVYYTPTHWRPLEDVTWEEGEHCGGDAARGESR